MPLFSDVLRYVNGRVPLLIELKLPDSNMKLCPAAWDILKDYKGPYMVQSFNSLGIRWFHKHAPQVLRGQLSSALNHDLDRIPMAVWTLRNQKAYKTARNKYDMYIFEGFSVK